MEDPETRSTSYPSRWMATCTRVRRRCSSGVRAALTVVAVHIERLFRKSPVPDPKKLNPLKMITRCLDISNYADALDLLVDEGLLEEDDGDGGTQERVFESIDDLQEADS